MIDIQLPWFWLYIGIDHQARWVRCAAAAYAFDFLLLPDRALTRPGEMTRCAWRISFGAYFLPWLSWTGGMRGVDSSAWTGRPHGEWRFWRGA
ncbi:hypothetical protein [Sphingobium yanoikuyae]|uniref:hypothetical protein n=1 Tax=Sphingobium yanoikuyae TaxID=13690 RepID=UPI0026F185F4|nr:hypothetical protein [Sphingobium yanoikuyae]